MNEGECVLCGSRRSGSEVVKDELAKEWCRRQGKVRVREWGWLMSE